MAARKDNNDAFNNLKVTIEGHIKDLKASEATSRKMLSLLSRELLAYVPDTGDIGIVNRLLAATTTSNRDYAILFFQNFLPWKLEENRTFGSKVTGEKLVAKKLAAIKVFLADDKNDIWSWSKDNVKPAQRNIDYGKGVANAVMRALDPEKGHMSVADVLRAVRDGGVEIIDIINLADAMKIEMEAAADKGEASKEKEEEKQE